MNVSGFTYSDYSGVWLGVSTADGSTPLYAREVTQNGMNDLGNVFPERVSLTMCYASMMEGITAKTYMDIPIGTYVFFNTPADSDLGLSSVTVSFPQGDYNQLFLSWPSGVYATNMGLDSNTYHVALQTLQVEDNCRYSVYAYLTGSAGMLCGWLVDQPFQLHNRTNNNFQFALDHALSTQSVSVNRPLLYLKTYAYRGGSCKPFVIFSGDSAGSGGQNYAVGFPDFPSSFRALWGYGSSGLESFSVWQKVETVPSSLDISDASVSGDYDPGTQTFWNVTVANGTADIIRGTWHTVSQGTPIDWVVSAPPQSTTLSFPYVPDSLLEMMPYFHPSSLNPTRLELDDFDPADDYDAAVQLEATSTAPIESRLAKRYHYTRTVHVTAD